MRGFAVTCRVLMVVLVALGPMLRVQADEELGYIYCLSARTALASKDFARAAEQIKKAVEADPASTEALLLRGDLAKAQDKLPEARKHYTACATALAAKRAWTRRDVAVRAALTAGLLSEEHQDKLRELASRQAGRWLDAARNLAREGSQASAEAAAEAAALLDPEAARAAAVTDYAADGQGWTPLVAAGSFPKWRQLRGKWSFRDGLLECQGAECLLAAPPETKARDLRFQVRGSGKARVRVDLGRFSVHIDFGAKRARAACLSPGMAFRVALKDKPWHEVSLIHRRGGLEASLDGMRIGLFSRQRVEGLVGVQIVGGNAAVREFDARPPQVEPEEPELPAWMRRRGPLEREMEPRVLTEPDDLIAGGRSLEAILKLTERRAPMVPHILSLSSALEQRGLDAWAAEVCEAGLKRGFVGKLAQKLALHRAHLALRLGDAARAAKLAEQAKDSSQSTIVLRGDAFQRLGKKPEAVAAWQAALKLDPLRDDIVARLKAAGVDAKRAAGSLALEKAVELLKPTVVVITGLRGGGSGFFLTPDGILLTNHHVIANVRVPKVTAIFQDGGEENRQTFPVAEVLAADEKLDLAVVRVVPRGRRFRPARLASGGIPKLGSKVLVIGSPSFGDIRLDYTVTQGIVSSGLRSLRGTHYVQTDAAINPGNSGGPVFNHRGEVIGVATAVIRFAQNVGFFVPTTLIRDYLKREKLP